MISLLTNISVNFTAEGAEEGKGGTIPTVWAHDHFKHQIFIKDQ